MSIMVWPDRQGAIELNYGHMLTLLRAERKKVQNAIDALLRCREMGLLGCDHDEPKLSARREGLVELSSHPS
jgi:hypothetical protein